MGKRITTPQEALSAAGEIIARDGWIQGELYKRPTYLGFGGMVGIWVVQDKIAREHAPVCALGALSRAITGRAFLLEDDLFEQACDLLCAEVNKPGHKGTSPLIPHWNDDPGTSKEDVILAFKRAASRETSLPTRE